MRLQHPLQMLLIFLSTLESWASSSRMTSSPCMRGPAVTVPSIRPPVAPPAGLPAVPTVDEPRGTPPVEDADPEELAVPAELVPGVVDTFAALPAPLGSLPELLRPPTLPGPVTPLTPAVPAPAAPALGAAPVAPDAPLADPPPADPPPADPPPPPPPPPAANTDTGARRAATTSNLNDNEQDIGRTPLEANAVENSTFQRAGTNRPKPA
jgi:hypothetical protein